MKFIVLLSALMAPSLVMGLLDVKMKAKGRKYIGSAADPNTFNDSTCKVILTADFGCVTPENSMKWDATEREIFFPLGPGVLRVVG
jgi:endo-1,4-beta-xylanase